MLPEISLHRFFRPFIESFTAPGQTVEAHPYARDPWPPEVREPLVIAVGPEGGFIDEELASFERAGFAPVTLGPRILRVETVIPVLVGRLCR